MTTSTDTRAPLRAGRASCVAVVAAATVRGVATVVAWWTLHSVAVDLESGSGRGASETVGAAVATIGVALGVSVLALLVAGPIFLTWLHRSRTGADGREGPRQRLGRGWVVGSWFVPLANYVLPWLVVVDMWRASAPDASSRPTPVHFWWLTAVGARLAHLAGWVVLVASIAGNAPQVEATWAIAVLHTVGALLELASAGLLALTVVEIDRGSVHLATRPRDGAAPRGPVGDPLVPDGAIEFYGRVLAAMRRSGRHLLVLETVTAVASVVFLLVVRPMHQAPGVTGPGAAQPPVPMSEWTAVVLPATVVVVAVFMIVRSASVVTILRQAAGRPVSVGEALGVALRRSPLLVGWTVVIAGVLVLVGYVLIRSGSLVVLAVVFLPVCLLVGMVLNLTLVGVVTVESGHLGRCIGLLRGRFWATFGRYLSIFPVFFVFSLLSNAVYVATGDGAVRAVLLTVVAVPFYVLVSACAAVVYAELRHHESGGRVLTPQLVAQLDGTDDEPSGTAPPPTTGDAPAPVGE